MSVLIDSIDIIERVKIDTLVFREKNEKYAIASFDKGYIRLHSVEKSDIIIMPLDDLIKDEWHLDSTD